MQKTFSAVLASFFLVTSVIGTGAIAAPRHNMHANQHGPTCGAGWNNNCGAVRRHSVDRYSYNHNNWGRHHRHGNNGVDAAAAALGFAVGAIVTGSVVSHVAACDDRYQSYDRRSDTFLGHDGYRHQCRL